MAIRVHNFNASGAMTSSGVEGAGEDDGAPPFVPGMNVHKDGEIDDAASRPASQAEIIAAAEKNGYPIPKMPKPTKASKPIAAPRAKPSLPQEGYVSDRRRCLELAVESRFGVMDPAQALAIAADFLAFLEGDGEPS